MKWTKEQDFLAFYFYRTGERMDAQKVDKICRLMRLEKSSLRMRIGNFKHLDGKSGLNHPAKMSKATFEKYRYSSVEEIEKIAAQILADSSSL